MAPYIWGQKNGVHLIDVSKTASQLDKVAKFLETLVASGKTILWVGTKKSARKAIEQVARTTKCPVVSHRWIGGTITNFPQVKKSVTKLLYLEDVIAKADKGFHTKKELSVMQKHIERINKNVGGIRKLIWPIAALVVVDVKKEHVAVSEARAAGIPVIALVDTNSDPSDVDFVIPTNDDAPKAVEFILDYLAQAVVEAQKVAAVAPPKEVAVGQPITIPEQVSIEEVLQKALGSDDDEGNASKKAKPTRPAVRRPARKTTE